MTGYRTLILALLMGCASGPGNIHPGIFGECHVKIHFKDTHSLLDVESTTGIAGMTYIPFSLYNNLFQIITTGRPRSVHSHCVDAIEELLDRRQRALENQ